MEHAGDNYTNCDWCVWNIADYINKWYVHKPESVLENETYKILCDFEMQTDYPIQKTRPSVN